MAALHRTGAAVTLALAGTLLSSPLFAQQNTCTTRCEPTNGYYAPDEDRARVAAQLDAMLVELRACLARVGAAAINPAVLARFNSDGTLASMKIDVGGYEELPCVTEASHKRLAMATKAETSLRCENRCGSPVAPMGAGATTPPTSGSASTPPPREPPRPRRAPPPVSDDDDRPEDDPFRSIALTLNPLSLILLRVGLNIEYLPATHHAIIANPFGQFISVGDESLSKTSYSNFGGELGYRFYTGSRSANGFFIGPFFSIMSANTKTTARNFLTGQSTEASVSFLAYGAGLDLGGQHVFKGGFVIGAGAGLQYWTSSVSTSVNSSTTVKFDGVLPRILFTLGYAF